MRANFQPPLQTQQRQIHVRSYDDLVNALGRIIANYRTQSRLTSNLGYEIIIADSFEVKRKIRLQKELSGLKFSSLGKIPIFPSSRFMDDCLFEVIGAASVTIENIYLADNIITGKYINDFVKVTSVESGILQPSIFLYKNYARALTLYRDEVGVLPYSIISKNHIDIPENTPEDIRVDSDYCLIEGNRFSSDFHVFNGEYTRIIGNDFALGDLYTSGTGTNPISGNTNLGGGSSTGLDPIGP